MYDVSFIISIDSSFEMTNNFFENFLNDNFVKNSQIIIVNDCVENIQKNICFSLTQMFSLKEIVLTKCYLR